MFFFYGSVAFDLSRGGETAGIALFNVFVQ